MMTEILNGLKPWIEWMHTHPHWLGVVVFAVVFFECLAVIGLFIPGTVVMVAVGALVGSGVISIHSVLLPAIAGSFVGDVTSFFIGYHYHEHLRDMWPFKFYPNLLKKGEAFFYRHGGKGIFIGRFIGPIRPILPIIAGMLNFKPWRFILADSISAAIWVPACIAPGFLLGVASVELPPNIAMHFMMYVILALLVLWCISWLLKRFVAWIFTTLHDALDVLWAAIKHKRFLRPLNIALQDPLHPESHAQLTLGLYFIFFAGIFVFMAWDVLHQGFLTAWNTPFVFLLRSLRNTIADHIMLMFTLMGEPKVWLGVFVVVFAWLLCVRAWRAAIYWGLLGVLGFGGAEVVKQLIHSPRPTGLMVTPSGYSFPSGHTTLSTIVGGFFAVLLARELPKEERWIPYTAITLLVLCIASSRVYLGAHWLTDVIGGMVFGITVVMLVTLLYCRHETPKLSPLMFTLVFTVSWLVMGTGYAVMHYEKSTKDYTLYIPAKLITMTSWWKHDGMDEPLYRANRVGKPTEALNIQWAGNLGVIEEDLLEQGWHISPNTTVGMLLDRLSQPKEAVHLPVLTQLYLDAHPMLVMTKTTAGDSLLVLRLWDGKTTFIDTGLPLWVGNVDYYKVKGSLSPVALFEKDLKAYHWKQLSYSPSQQKLSSKWDGQLVMIKPRLEMKP